MLERDVSEDEVNFLEEFVGVHIDKIKADGCKFLRDLLEKYQLTYEDIHFIKADDEDSIMNINVEHEDPITLFFIYCEHTGNVIEVFYAEWNLD